MHVQNTFTAGQCSCEQTDTGLHSGHCPTLSKVWWTKTIYASDDDDDDDDDDDNETMMMMMTRR